MAILSLMASILYSTIALYRYHSLQTLEILNNCWVSKWISLPLKDFVVPFSVISYTGYERERRERLHSHLNPFTCQHNSEWAPGISQESSERGVTKVISVLTIHATRVPYRKLLFGGDSLHAGKLYAQPVISEGPNRAPIPLLTT